MVYFTQVLCVSETGIILNMKQKLPSGNYNINLTVGDHLGLSHVTTIKATVCDCKGANVTCSPRSGDPQILAAGAGIVGAVLALLCKFISQVSIVLLVMKLIIIFLIMNKMSHYQVCFPLQC